MAGIMDGRDGNKEERGEEDEKCRRIQQYIKIQKD